MSTYDLIKSNFTASISMSIIIIVCLLLNFYEIKNDDVFDRMFYSFINILGVKFEDKRFSLNYSNLEFEN